MNIQPKLLTFHPGEDFPDLLQHQGGREDAYSTGVQVLLLRTSSLILLLPPPLLPPPPPTVLLLTLLLLTLLLPLLSRLLSLHYPLPTLFLLPRINQLKANDEGGEDEEEEEEVEGKKKEEGSGEPPEKKPAPEPSTDA